jgi:hypothetical protein
MLHGAGVEDVEHFLVKCSHPWLGEIRSAHEHTLERVFADWGDMGEGKRVMQLLLLPDPGLKEEGFRALGAFYEELWTARCSIAEEHAFARNFGRERRSRSAHGKARK